MIVNQFNKGCDAAFQQRCVWDITRTKGTSSTEKKKNQLERLKGMLLKGIYNLITPRVFCQLMKSEPETLQQ